MIVDLPSTTTSAVAAKLVRLRADTGSMATRPKNRNRASRKPAVRST